jgi:hypothetical protein
MESFNKVGFLSEHLLGWTKQVRLEFADSFDLVDRVNRLGMKILLNLPSNNMTDAHLFANACFGRALEAYQSCLLLAERGAAPDARGAARTCAEVAIVISALKNDPETVSHMQASADLHRYTLINSILDKPDTKAILDDGEIANFERIKKEILIQYGGQKPKDMKLATIADQHGTSALYNTVYRLTSGDGPHPTLRALERYTEVSSDSASARFKFEPSKSDLPSTLLLAASPMLLVISLIVEWFELTAFVPEFEECIAAYDRHAE